MVAEPFDSACAAGRRAALRIPVEDPGDARIADFVGLRDHDLRRRREDVGGDLAGLFVAEGDVVVSRALRAGYRCRAVLVDATRRQPVPDDVLAAAEVVYEAGVRVLERITGMGVHRGMLATFDRRPLPSVATVLADARRVVVLENVVNPTNLGVIARTAAAFGVDALLIDRTSCDPLYRRASRVAMGEIFALPYTRVDRLPGSLTPLVELGFRLVALTPAADARTLASFAGDLGAEDRVALLLGAEGHGLADETMTRCERVRIPIDPRVDSLNVGAAAAVAMAAISPIRT